MKQTLSCTVVFAILLMSCTKRSPGAGTGVLAKHAMVVTAHPEASRIGKGILEQGGNAVDAAVGIQLALSVCYPVAGNLGGGGFMVARFSDGTADAIDFRERAPAGAEQDMYLDDSGRVIAGMSTYSHLAVGVPGTVAGIIRMHEKYGRLPFRELIQPSVELARSGFPLTENQARSLNEAREGFVRYNEVVPVYVKNGLWKAGDSLKQEDLAHSLELIRDKGRMGFYAGEVAEGIAREMAGHGGLVTMDDLAGYEARFREPVTGNFGTFRVLSMPPPSSGGIALIQLLNMVEPFHVERYDFLEARCIHLMVEAERRVYADRSEYLGDPDFTAVPVAELTDPQYCRERMSDFDPDRATRSPDVGAGTIPGYESEETTHYSVVDAGGNAVAGTTTLNRSYGSRIVVPGTGIILNDEMDDFSMKPGVPNTYGLTGGTANSVQPGKRMLSSMTPTIVEKNGNLYMVLGSPGGATIITSVFQVMLDVLEFGMSMQEAVSVPRFHHQWLPDVIQCEENGLKPDVIRELESMGHTIEFRSPIGRVDAILVRDDGMLEAGADPRGDDAAAGY